MKAYWVFVQLSTFLLVTLWDANGQNSSNAGSKTTMQATVDMTKSMPVPAKAEDNVWVTSGLVADLSLSDYPAAELEVKYGTEEVCLNMSLTPEQTSKAPTVRLKGAINCMPPFALVMVDPDAPSRSDPKFRSWMHWLVLNANSTERLHEGEEAVEYAGPAPPPGSGPHRYAFLAYCQGAKRLEAKKLAPAERPKFQLEEFVKEAKLMKRPFGGTFFFAENPCRPSYANAKGHARLQRQRRRRKKKEIL